MRKTDSIHRQPAALVALLGAVAAAIGGSVLAGWATEVDALKSLVPGAVPIDPTLGLGFALSGVSVSLARLGHSRAARAGMILSAVGSLVLAVLWFADGLGPYAASCLALVSLGLLTMGTRAAAVSSGLGLLAATAAGFGLIGYAIGLSGPNIEAIGEMAIPSATAFFVLGAALVVSHPQHGSMRLFLSEGMGGAVARRVVPLAVAGIVALATLRVLGEEAGLYGTREGVWLFTCVALLLIVPIIWHVALFVERADQERQSVLADLAELVERDPLTGIYNRRRLDEELARQLAGIERYGGSLALLVVDLDGFKAANDSLGHKAGDAILIAAATAMQDLLRASDLVARFGGDEFVVLLPEASTETAAAVADKLCQAVAELKVQMPITASVGGVVCEGATAPTLTPDWLLTLADKELYRAKEDGRNCVNLSTVAGFAALSLLDEECATP